MNCSKMSGYLSHSRQPVLLPLIYWSLQNSRRQHLTLQLYRQSLISILSDHFSLRSCPCQSTSAVPQQEAFGSPLNAASGALVTMVIILRRQLHHQPDLLTIHCENHNSFLFECFKL